MLLSLGMIKALYEETLLNSSFLYENSVQSLEYTSITMHERTS